MSAGAWHNAACVLEHCAGNPANATALYTAELKCKTAVSAPEPHKAREPSRSQMRTTKRFVPLSMFIPLFFLTAELDWTAAGGLRGPAVQRSRPACFGGRPARPVFGVGVEPALARDLGRELRPRGGERAARRLSNGKERRRVPLRAPPKRPWGAGHDRGGRPRGPQ
eukprot:4247152-Pyramimonas_sp.AAC.1